MACIRHHLHRVKCLRDVHKLNKLHLSKAFGRSLISAIKRISYHVTHANDAADWV